MTTDSSNTIFQQAVAFVNQTSSHIFLSGKAGTGKTTFLRYIKENSFKKMAIVAPTGVAAINAGGVTIHSLFQLPVTAFIPVASGGWGSSGSAINNKNSLLHGLRLRSARRDLLRELELLIIDEVSMVRADLLDAVDTVLRHVRRQPALPFGGVQIVYIGDLFQLPPVVKNDEWSILQQYYESPFFFDAKVMQQAPPVYIELKKIYRQKDNEFIEVLNKIRNNCCTASELQLLNSFYKPGFVPAREDNYITLTSHNSKADAINEAELNRLPGKTFVFNADVTGEFDERIFPAEKALRLKVGAQVMFIKNDKGEERRFYNGKIGTIEKITTEKVTVVFANETEPLELEQEKWQNIRYDYNDEKDTIREEELGTFSQYPVRLAWAITIHKSQGLTFEKAIIDAGASFAPGQVYVALSRLTSLNGLVLLSPIHSASISTHQRAAGFVEYQPGETVLAERLETEKRNFIHFTLMRAFGVEKLLDKLNSHFETYSSRQIPAKESCIAWCEQLLQSLNVLDEVANKFARQLQQLFDRSATEGFTLLHSRTVAAADYFVNAIDEKLVIAVKAHIEDVKTRKKVKKYLAELHQLVLLFERKKQQLQQAVLLSDSLNRSVALDTLMAMVQKAPQVSDAKPQPEGKKEKLAKGDSARLSLRLFREGKSIADIAADRQLAVSTIEGHLAAFVATREVDILDLVTAEQLDKAAKVWAENGDFTLTELRNQMANDISFGQLRAIVNHLEQHPPVIASLRV